MSANIALSVSSQMLWRRSFTFSIKIHSAFMSSETPSKVSKMSENNVHDEVRTAKTDKTVADQVEAPTMEALEYKYRFNNLSNDGSVLKFKKISDNATTPLRGSRNAAGFDLFAAEDKVIAANGHGRVFTDISVSLPIGSYGRVAPRSGLAFNKFIDVGAGVVDRDYRGNIGVILFNHLGKVFEVKKGDRIAQFVVEKIFMPKLLKCDDLDETERGSGAYGSTGA